MKRILEYTPLIYALLVFVGYINLHSYYSAFGIEIWTYLSTGELLLSFLNMSPAILITAGLLLALQVSVFFVGAGPGKDLIVWLSRLLWEKQYDEDVRRGHFSHLRMLVVTSWMLVLGVAVSFIHGMLYGKEMLPPGYPWQLGILSFFFLNGLGYYFGTRSR